MEIIKVVSENEKRDIVKAGNAVDAFKNHVGETLKMVGVVMYVKDEVNTSTGEKESKTVTAIKTADGNFISTISPTVYDSVSNICGAYSDEEILQGVDIMVCSGKANSGREFYYCDLA